MYPKNMGNGIASPRTNNIFNKPLKVELKDKELSSDK
jgi:hypothetical protein